MFSFGSLKRNVSNVFGSRSVSNSAPAGLKELNDELAALGSAQLRSMLLEERQSVPKYKALLAASSGNGSAATDEPGTPTQSEGPLAGLSVGADSPDVKEKGVATAAPGGPAVTFSLVPEYKQVALGPTTAKVVISLKATAEVSKPADVAVEVVIDKSGSMSGGKLELVRSTVTFLVDKLKPQDALGLVTYGDEATRNMPLINMTRNGKALARAVNAAIHDDGMTALHDGLNMGIAEHALDAADSNSGPRRVRGVFLCTDGLPNVGPSDALSIVKAMRAKLAPLTAQGEQVAVHTFGFGSDHDPKLLQAIAEAGNGIYYYIQDDKQIPEAFGDALGGLLSVVASSVTVTARLLGQETRLTRVEAGGSQERPAPGQVSVRFPDLFAEEERELLLEMELPAVPQEGSQQLVEVEVAFTHPATGEVTRSSQVLAVERCAAPAPGQAPDPLVATTAARFMVAEALRVAATESEAGQFDAAATRVQKTITTVQQDQALGEAQQAFVSQLAGMADAINSARRTTSSREERQVASTKMASCSNAFYLQRSAGVGVTSCAPVGSDAATAPTAFFATAPTAPTGAVGGAPWGMAQQGANVLNFSKVNRMRQFMSSEASKYSAPQVNQS